MYSSVSCLAAECNAIAVNGERHQLEERNATFTVFFSSESLKKTGELSNSTVIIDGQSTQGRNYQQTFHNHFNLNR